MRWTTALIIACLAAVSPAQPDEAETTAENARIITSLDGLWTGALQYRDFGTDKLVKLPARVELEASTGSTTLIRRAEFTDPGYVVVSLGAMSLQGDRYTDADLGDGETTTYRVLERRFEDNRDWTLVLSADGEDNGTPADLRVTMVMDGAEFRSTKEVRAKATPEAGFAFRNAIILERDPLDPESLLGSWTIDLRPSPDADPYPVTLAIESVENGAVTGTFYNGSPIRSGRLTTSWGRVSFAFVTEDGTGEYHTTATLLGDQLRGTTHSIGRNFLMEWAGVSAN